MYRAFVKGESAKQPEPKSEFESELNKPKDKEGNEPFYEAVKTLWGAVEIQCADIKGQNKNTEDSNIYADLGWIVIRVFVSSTFNDFFNEREVLVKKVFPELREWCSEHGMKYVECDLRWGIPRDTPTGDTILVCLDEIQRCRDENKDLPFFLCLIGERYGWIPKQEEVPDEAREKYGWIDEFSITFNEILTGAFRDQNPNAAFFFRDESICKSIPESFLERFVEAEALPRQHLKVMKQKISERFPDQVYTYSCKFKEVSSRTGREQVEFSELDDFAEKVSTFFKSAIERTYPRVNEKSDLAEDSAKLEETVQRLFIIDKAKNLMGRQAEIDILKRFAHQGTVADMEITRGSDNKMRKAENWDLHDDDNKICVVQGISGLGKTALLCHIIKDCLTENANIFYHMVGSTPSSIRVETLLERLVQVLAPEILSEKDKNDGQSYGIFNLQKQLRKALGAFRESPDKTLIICIDALDQLENKDTLDHLSWLPPTFPRNIRCIVSTSEHLPTTSRLYEYPLLKFNLSPLTKEDLQQIMTRYLGNFSKKLEPGQVEKIIKDTGADSPLWVMLMAEELRIFGDFRLMADKINNLPCSLNEFLVQVLDRVIQEDERGVIKKVLCLVACSRFGSLPSRYFLHLCGDMKAQEELPLMYLAQARRTLKPYLRVTMVLNDSVAFSHQAVLQAVNKFLLSTEASRREWYILLADFYQTLCTNPREKVWYLPYYLQRANLKKRLVDFITKDKDSLHIMPSWQRSDLLKSARCQGLADAVMPNTAPVLICHSCATFKRFHPACTWPTKDCCMLCSNYCGGGLRSNLARACMMHAGGRGPNLYKCLMCNLVVQEKTNRSQGPRAPIPAVLCNHCSFGIHGRQCAHFAV
ncbi:telomerase protein component 1-like [Plakobranchus ocellatus]|uniref:Telomerase protein component 1-like n=1 Tax=Plakobranchus ocellatus TaxID=259542 RepID=A0AAV3ZE51_9GAST|nr:telomerase protein component 1-like [Plakobranchus ocellatus]